MKYKLGKKPARKDARTIKLKTILKAENLPPLPASYDIDVEYPSFADNNMYGNDTLGDCVMAGRAHMTLRFEEYEQNLDIPISDNDVTTEYFKETGGSDSGLDMLTSLNCWRDGWEAAGEGYSIYAYAAIDYTNSTEAEYAIMLLRGAYIGLQLPNSAMQQFDANQSWSVVDNDEGTAGGHCVYCMAYDSGGIYCMTWGKRQYMTWGFFLKYCDEAFAIVQQKEPFVANSPVDCDALDQLLNEIDSPEPTPQPAPNPNPSGTTPQ